MAAQVQLLSRPARVEGLRLRDRSVARLSRRPRARGTRSVRPTVQTHAAITRVQAPSIQDAETKAAERERAIQRSEIPAPYSPEALAAKFKWRPHVVAARVGAIGANFAVFGAALAADYLTGSVERNMPRRAQQFRETLTNLGPTFVKVGQALSTRPDLAPPLYVEELAELQDALPTFEDGAAFACIEAQLGGPVDQFYEAITRQPIAAASLGQVYKARLVGGAEVAVKVQRPNILGGIELDIFIVRLLTGLVDRYLDSLTTSLVGLVDDFAARVFQELNYIQEGLNCERFADLYGDRVDVLVPEIYWGATSTKVLTMEWVDGIKLSDQFAIESQNLDLLQLVDTGIQCSLRQLLEEGFFHADPHPGNLLATPDGRLAFLDFGMMSETPPTARLAIISHVVHLVNRDYEAMARDYYTLDFLDPSVDVRPIVPALRDFFDDVLKATVSELNFKTITDGLGAVLYAYPFNVPSYYALILRSLTVLEGLALYTDPNFKVLAKAYPYMARRLLTDPSDTLRDALADLLFKDGTFRWDRLENLLREGQKNDAFDAEEVIPSVLELMLGEGEGGKDNRLRRLVEEEAVRVVEALTLGEVLDRTRGLAPDAIPGGEAVAAAGGRLVEDRAKVEALREQVLRVWALLNTSSTFDARSLQPLLQVVQDRKAQELGVRIGQGYAQRVTARAVRAVLRGSPGQSDEGPLRTPWGSPLELPTVPAPSMMDPPRSGRSQI